MGKGDKKSTKGKRNRGSYGKTRRPRKDVLKARKARAADLASATKTKTAKSTAKPKPVKESNVEATAKKAIRKPKVKKEDNAT